MEKKYTIKDIARIAKVSVATVSRAINNAKDINEETKAKILKIIQELQYNPNPAAKALVSQSSKYIAVIVPNIHHSAISKIVQGIIMKLQEEDLDVLLLDYNESREVEEHYLNIVDQKMIDGLIMITSIAKESDILAIAKRLPTVLIERVIESDDIDSVLIDEDSAMLQLLEYLISKGHHKIGFINGEKGTSSAELRLNSFQKCMEKLNLHYNENCIIHSNWSLLGGKEAFIKLIESKCDCTAIVCSSDQLALGALGASYKLGISVPENMSIVGFDNFDEGLISIPPLTTMDYPAFKMGEVAANLILERIKEGRTKLQKSILPSTLLKRESVKEINLDLK